MPATDDELMEVEDFLDDDVSEMHDVADTVQIVGHICNEGSSSAEKTQLENSEGLLMLPLPLILTLLFLLLHIICNSKFKADKMLRLLHETKYSFELLDGM